MNLRAIEMGILFAVDIAVSALSIKLSLTIKEQGSVIKKQNELILLQGDALENAGRALETRLDEDSIRAGLRGCGHIAIGMMHEDNKYFAMIVYPGGETFQGPKRETEEEAVADVMEKADEILEMLGPCAEVVYGPGMGPVH